MSSDNTVAAAAALLPTILEQEKNLRFPYFSSREAFEIGSAIREQFLKQQDEGKFENRGIVINIKTFSGHTLFTCSCGVDSAVGPNNWVWVEGKTEVVRLHNHSSYYQGRKAVADGGQPAPYAHGGGFPVWIKGCPSAPYAIIVVSGLAQQDDHQIIIDVLSEYIPKLKKLEE
ncbi:hypothetical protein FRC02_007108 [Tulasnella sp. 418]|nr:hypothetical protein FRC02_007108 [Tulasnella sp. 418]